MFDHPKNVCMTYFTHFKFAMGLSFELFVGSVKSFIHAIVPDLFVTSTSDLLKSVDFKIQNSGCRKIL